MTLTEALQLNEKYLEYDDLRALEYCERRYREAGAPAERWELINFLERMLQELKSQGGYPKVLLLRKKEIQRQQFTVRKPRERPVAECSCFGGWLLNGTACSCPRGEGQRKRLRAWGMKI